MSRNINILSFEWENRNRFVRSSSEESTKEPEPSPRQVIVNSSVWQDDWHFRTTPWKEAFIAQVDEKLRKFSYKVSFIFIETDFHLRSLSDCRQPSPWPLLHKKKIIPLCTFLEFCTHLEANSARSFENAFYKCLRALNIIFLKTSNFWWMSSFLAYLTKHFPSLKFDSAYAVYGTDYRKVIDRKNNCI